MHRSQRPHRKLAARIEREARLAIRRLRGKPLLHFLHIGKTGGSALKHALKPHRSSGRYQIVLHKHGVRLRDIREGEKFMFAVRDPLSRFVSGFYSRQREGRPRIHSPWSPAEKVAFERFSTPDALGVALDSADSDEREAARAAMEGIGHVRSSYWLWFEDPDYFRSRLGDLLFVAFQERLSEDFVRLRSLLGIPDAALPADDLRAHRNPERLDRRLSERAEANLRTWYTRDFEFIELCRTVVRDRT